MKNKLLFALCALSFVPVALYADSVEGSDNLNIGSILWVLAIGLGLTGIALQARRVGVTPVVAVVALIPFLNFLIIPVTVIFLTILPTKEKLSGKSVTLQVGELHLVSKSAEQKPTAENKRKNTARQTSKYD